MDQKLFQKVQILMQQNRTAEAGRVLSQLLEQDPTNVSVLILQSEVHLESKQPQQALDLIHNALSLAPDEDMLYFVEARALVELERYDEAEQSLETAISIDPSFPNYHAFWSSIKLSRKQYKEALRMADKALALDPENLLALNIRSSALLKLNHKEASMATIQEALEEDPNNPFTHTNFGWNLLEKGDPGQAMVHFKEALSIDPNFQFAREGMAQALKARYWLYRMFLKYAFWIGNLTAKYQWGVIIGFYLVARGLGRLADTYPALEPFLMPVLILLALIAFSTWVISPISNLFLRLNPYGRHLLEPHEVKSSNFVGGSLLVCGLALLALVATGNPAFLVLAGAAFCMMVPFSVMFNMDRFKSSIQVYGYALLVTGILAFVTAYLQDDPINTFSILFFLGFFVFQWVANFFAIKAGNR